MRFSLTTLILFTLLLAMLMTVWFWREPWVKDGTSETAQNLSIEQLKRISPDGTREVTPRIELAMERLRFSYQIQTAVNGEVLGTIYGAHGFNAYFMTDAEILVEDGYLPSTPGGFAVNSFQRYRRRFPEWWWGHFYRPEVWASIALFFSLVIHFVRARNQRNAGR